MPCTMNKPPSPPSPAQPPDDRSSPAKDGGVIAVTRALQRLGAFALGESHLSLAELSRRCALHKTTVLRLARTLAQSGFMVQRDDGDWRLGPAAGWLGARYQAGFDVQNVLEPALRALTQASGESAAFYVRERSEEHTSELQSPDHLVCRLLLEKQNCPVFAQQSG